MIFLQRFPEKYCKFETKKPRNLGSKTFAMKSLKTSLKDCNVCAFKKHQHLYIGQFPDLKEGLATKRGWCF